MPLGAAIATARARMGDSADFIVREIGRDAAGAPKAAVFYIEELADAQKTSELIETLIHVASEDADEGSPAPAALLRSMHDRVHFGSTTSITTDEAFYAAILSGSAVVLVNECRDSFAVAVQGGDKRSIEEPSSQTVIRGPKEGFTEVLSSNLGQLRRRLRTTQLRIEHRSVGRFTRTQIAIAYIEGIANPTVLAELRRRLDAIDIDGILESGYLEELIQDRTFTPFPTIFNTERPDAIAGHLLEGHCAVLVDGTPFALVLPVTFFKFFLSSEDYYQRFDIITFIRAIRFLSFFVSLLLPSLYVAVTTFQQEMMPTTLLISLAAQREGVPLPALLEALLMELTFEVIREAGVRMPRVIGPAISIVGALVLGQAAVQAGLVSGAMVIVVSFTAIANFVIPSVSMAASIRLIRFGLMLLAGTFGLYGILAGTVPLLIHLVSLSSFGVPYFLPAAPLSLRNLKDVFVRVPWKAMRTRPEMISVLNRTREGNVPSSRKEKE
ncbi:spore germination protein [Cohnella hongkongensis]